MPIVPLECKQDCLNLEEGMGVKLGSVVMVLMMFFIAKISFETAMAERSPDRISERSPASIDQSYNDHLYNR